MSMCNIATAHLFNVTQFETAHGTPARMDCYENAKVAE